MGLCVPTPRGLCSEHSEYHLSDLRLLCILWTVLVSSQALGLVGLRPTFPLPLGLDPASVQAPKPRSWGRSYVPHLGLRLGQVPSASLQSVVLVTWGGVAVLTLTWAVSHVAPCLSGPSARTSGLCDHALSCPSLVGPCLVQTVGQWTQNNGLWEWPWH